MSITLTAGATTIVLPPDLYWEDEFGWTPVEQTEERGVTGAQIIDLGERIGGRPMTLGPDPGGGESAWIHRGALDDLYALAEVPGQEMTLNLRGLARTVMWAHQAGQAIEAEPVLHMTDIDSTDYYRVKKLRFMEI